MDSLNWRREVARSLARERLPKRYSERLMDELSNHLDDVMEDDSMLRDSIDKVLGAPTDLASVAATEYRRHRFAGRHPRLVFVVLPFLSLPILWVAAMLLIVICSDWLGLDQTQAAKLSAHQSISTAAVVASRLAVILPGVVAAIAFCWVARRAALSAKWPLLACCMLGLLTGLASIQLSLNPDGQRTLLFGLGFSTSTALSQLMQLAIPLVVASLFVWRMSESARRLEVA